MAETLTLIPESELRDENSDKKQESREEMLARHRKEKAKLQEKELGLKKAAAKGSKAEQKAKKKQVEEQITVLSSELESKQAQELASLGYNDNNDNNNNNSASDQKSKSNLDNLVKAIAGVSCSAPQTEASKPSKSAKRRGKRVQEEIARELRIQEEQNNLVSDRMIENENLGKKLEPLGLKINEIKPDGHCLYRAVENQLVINNAMQYDFQELREMTGKYMRENKNDFIPFFLSEGKADLNEDPIESFEKYCDEIKSTAIWGGQLELGALSHVLKKHIVVYSGFLPNVEMGKEYKDRNADTGNNWSILLSYHKHAFGLGEHYNSVVPIGE